MTFRPAPLAVASLSLAALTLLYPSAPTYDPWAWIVWGREILHLDLSTVAGPSWKPLPVLFTTPFALFGSAAPALWLVVARAGGIAAAVAAFAVARRLGGIVAGAAAVGGLILAPWFVRNVALGNSEGLMVAAVLAAAHRHLAGRPREAFAWGVGAALIRPEAWPFLGVYALWLLYSERRAVSTLLLVGLGSLPVLWFLPELWGSGSLLRSADRAQQPLTDSPAFAAHPAMQLVRDAAGLVTVPVWIGIGLALALILAGRVDRRHALPALAVASLAVLWVAEVAVMTRLGYSGNVRYLIVPEVLLIVVGAVGVGWVGQAAVARGTRVASTVTATATAAAVAVLFAVPALGSVDGVRTEIRYQGQLPHRLATAVTAAGGARRLRACGAPYTGPFFVPAVAWQLHVHTSQVGVDPRAPAVVFRVRTKPTSPPVPSLDALHGTPTRTLAQVTGWRIVGAC